jgi:23S rRNA pseudouridine1911/1915/1917 synthase
MRATPEDLPLDIVYEDDNLLVINKSSGMVVHPSPGHPGGTVVNGVLHHCGPITTEGDPLRPGIVHRLDKDTTGLMVVAKNDRAHKELSGQLQAREMLRVYFTIVMGRRLDDTGTYSTQYGRHPNDRIKFSSRVQSGKVATTHWQLMAAGELCALVAVRLETGRTHQIRVHFADFGHPVAGDPLYGTSLKGFNTSAHPKEGHALAQLPHQALHAGILGLRKPGAGEESLFSAPPPATFLAVVEAAFGQEAVEWVSDPLRSAKETGLDTLLEYG